MSAPQGNTNTAAPPAAGGSSGQEDYVDKGLDAIEKKFGRDPAKMRSMNEKITDAGRGFFEKMTGKKVPENGDTGPINVQTPSFRSSLSLAISPVDTTAGAGGAPGRMNALPHEIVGQIVSFLDRTTLLAASLVNRQWEDATRPHKFHTVYILSHTDEQTTAKSLQSIHTLTMADAFKHVRQLHVRKPRDYLYSFRSRRHVVNPDYDCLMRLISKLPHLRELHWDFPLELPACLLSELVRRTDCHLSLGQRESTHWVDRRGWRPWYDTDGGLFADATNSQLLRRIEVDCNCSHPQLLAACLSFLTESPNLRNLRFSNVAYPIHLLPNSSPIDFPLDHNLAANWKPCRLENLTLDAMRAGSGFFRFLRPILDLTTLQTLHIKFPFDVACLEWMTADCEFPSLHTLIFDTVLPWPLPDRQTKQDWSSTYLNLVRMIPRLHTLELKTHWDFEFLEPALQHQGNFLKRISLGLPRGNYGEKMECLRSSVRCMKEWCPSLEHLTMPVILDQGGPGEVRLYQEIGQVPGLRAVTLRLVCLGRVVAGNFKVFDHEGYLETYDDLEEFLERLNRNIKHGFSNCAIDGKLVQAIFRIISTSCSARLRPLDSLTLTTRDFTERDNHQQIPAGPKPCCYAQYKQLCFCISGAWECERDPCSDKLRAQRVDHRYWDTAYFKTRKVEETTEVLKNLFFEVWPEAAASDEWWKAYSSLPLAETSSNDRA